MNVAVIVPRTTAGLASYLRDVVGNDAPAWWSAATRASADFRTAALGVLDAASVDVIALPPAVAAPVVAYATRALNCDAGIIGACRHLVWKSLLPWQYAYLIPLHITRIAESLGPRLPLFDICTQGYKLMADSKEMRIFLLCFYPGGYLLVRGHSLSGTALWIQNSFWLQ